METQKKGEEKGAQDRREERGAQGERREGGLGREVLIS